MKMRVSRRDFLAGSLASLGAGALGGRIFAAPPGWKPAKNPKLVFGILSDTHLMVEWDGKSLYRTMTLDYIRNAFRLFKNRGIDAFVHLGDAAHRGCVREWEFHGPVKIIIVGNHELFGGSGHCKGVYRDPKSWQENAICADLPRHYERVWGEPYSEVFHKVVKGYHFFGRHWNEKEYDGVGEKPFADYILSNAAPCSLRGTKPFFILSHKRHHFATLNALRAFPNAVAFCGHWHQRLTNWNMILFWLNENVPELRCPSCAPFGGLAPHHDGWIFKDKKAGVNAREIGAWRQGMVMRVYDDMIVFERKEFGDGGVSSLGQDWIMPLGKYAPHPFSREELRKIIGSPQFGKNVGLKVESVKLESGEDAVRVSIPLADGNPKSRVYAYEVVVSGEECSQNLVKSVYDAGCNVGIGHEPGVTTLVMPKSELPPGNTLTVAVRPFSSLGTLGMAIAAKFET